VSAAIDSRRCKVLNLRPEDAAALFAGYTEKDGRVLITRAYGLPVDGVSLRRDFKVVKAEADPDTGAITAILHSPAWPAIPEGEPFPPVEVFVQSDWFPLVSRDTKEGNNGRNV
jgi:hypothetical protein